jgi:hypothetical protein
LNHFSKDLKRLYCHHPTLLPDNTCFEPQEA